MVYSVIYDEQLPTHLTCDLSHRNSKLTHKGKNMKKIDRRVQRTRRTLGEALFALVEEKEYHKISIRELTERADMAYATFFRHYETKEGLLMEQLQAVLHDIETQASMCQETYFVREGELLFQHIQAHTRRYQNLLRHKNVVSCMKRMIIENVKSHAIQRYHHLPEPQVPLMLLLEHNVSSLLNLIAWWLDNRQKTPIDDMARYYERLVIASGWWAANGISTLNVDRASPLHD